MKKLVFIALAGLVSLVSLSSCNKETALTDDALKQKIVGKWKLYSVSDEIVTAEEKEVYTFKADGTHTLTSFVGGRWNCAVPGRYDIKERNLTIVNPDIVSTLSFQTIDKESLVLRDVTGRTLEYRKVTENFSTSFLGMWEGVQMTGGQTYGDAEHCWEYKSDGSYVYYSKDEDGNWIPDPDNEGNIYFVDGDFVGTCWINSNVEYMESWDIVSCNSYEMVWIALRENPDGTTFTTTFQMKKELSQQEICEKIVGKWKSYSINDAVIPTDSRTVNTFDAYGRYLQTTFVDGKWDCQVIGDYYVQDKELYMGVTRCSVVAINDQEMIFSPVKASGRIVSDKQVWHRVTEDFSDDIIGIWEGVIMTGDPTYGDIDHRWEYKSDGTYEYYSKDEEGNWKAQEGNDGKYFVDGDYLCFRWSSGGNYHREFWDIDTCDESTMIWSALRQNPQGETFDTVFVLVKVED